jgi:DNA-binding winged helix-turn-helix (wHTH) protein/Tol biopolymer transport system component
MLKGPSGANWEFEGFRVMTEMRLLISGDRPVPLTSKAFDTLVVLIENRDRIVTKDELLSSVWPDVEVEEGNLTQQIFLLRKALGETAQQPRHIVTVPGHGYRFTASVRAIANEAAATALSSNAAVSPPAAPRRGVTFIATVLVAIGVITFGLRWMPLDNAAAPDFTRHVTKITESGKVSASAISRDGRYVAYVENDGDQYSLWLTQVGAEGKTPVIPRQPLLMGNLRFSPDGEYIYFGRRSPPGPMGVLYRVPTLGGLATPLLEDVDGPISFSPDGRQLAFLRGAVGNESHIIVVAADGTSPQILARRKEPLRFTTAPEWSPDGKVVAAAVTDIRNGASSIDLLSLDAGSSRSLYQTSLGIGRLRWLPDGSGLLTVMLERAKRPIVGAASGGAIWRIEYPSGKDKRMTADLANYDPCCLDIGANGGAVANVNTTLVSDLWIASADRPSALIKQLTSDHAVIGRHSWLPDNATMVYRTVNGRLHSVRKDGQPFNLAVPPGEEVTGGVSACGDGRYVVFTTAPAQRVWRVSPSAGGPYQLARGFNSACTPDGRWVLYAFREPDYVSLWRVSIDGGEPTPLDLTSSYDVLPSPTGRMILYQTDKVEKDADRNRPDRWEVMSSSDRNRLFAFDVKGDGDIGMMTKWAPDESGLDYVVTRNGVSNIWRQKLTGGPPIQITQFSVGRIFSFAWSPDGQWLSLGLGAYRSDVVLMSSQPQ